MKVIGTVGQLREAIDGLPDQAEVTVELDDNGWEIDVEVSVVGGRIDGDSIMGIIINVDVAITETDP